jgi:hypothetical protein
VPKVKLAASTVAGSRQGRSPLLALGLRGRIVHLSQPQRWPRGAFLDRQGGTAVASGALNLTLEPVNV